jgi:hypothetical protein
LSDDRLLVYLPTARSAKLLEAIASSGAIAMVFSEPRSHKTIQVKGSDAELLSDTHADPALLAKYRSGLRSHLVPLGFSEAMVDALVKIDAAGTTAVMFTPTSVFDQTPGPRAGEPLVPTR